MRFWPYHQALFPKTFEDTNRNCASRASGRWKFLKKCQHSSTGCKKRWKKKATYNCKIILFFEWGLCEHVIVHTNLPPSQVILWIELGGKPKWLPLKFECHDKMCKGPFRNKVFTYKQQEIKVFPVFCMRFRLPPPSRSSPTQPFIRKDLWIINDHPAGQFCKKKKLPSQKSDGWREDGFEKVTASQNNFMRNQKLTCANSSIPMVTRQAAAMVAANRIKASGFIATVVKIFFTLISIWRRKRSRVERKLFNGYVQTKARLFKIGFQSFSRRILFCSLMIEILWNFRPMSASQ